MRAASFMKHVSPFSNSGEVNYRASSLVHLERKDDSLVQQLDWVVEIGGFFLSSTDFSDLRQVTKLS